MKFKVVVNNFKEKTKNLITKFENMENKKNIVFMAIGAITLIAVTLGATYAYFTAQSGGRANIDTDVITGTTDNLSFSFGDEINIYATEENFAQGMGNLTDNTTAQAILRANNTSNEATANYNIYLIIESNDFEYTTENQTPEILLNVTDPNGNPVENITGLVHYEDGFDITTRTGGFLLVPDYEISATTAQTIQDWNIEVTFVNLDSDQNANTNKTLTGKLYLTQDKMSSYELTQISNIDASTTYNSIDATLDITNGSAAVSKYYYGIEKTSEAIAYNNTNSIRKLNNTLASAEDVEYIESDTPNYEFTNLEANTEYTIYSYVEDENKIKSNVYETTVTTSEYKIPIVDSVSHSVTLNSITLNVTAINGSNEIVKYMYSKDNGVSWEESISNTHTFSNLTDSTEYKIKVKVVDSENVESTEYYEAITTEIYILPVVASVEASTTWNSITLTPSGTNGTNTIDHYEYSIENGEYQTSNVFSNLNENTQYTIGVKAIDTAGRESNVYTLQVTTDTYELPVINNVTVDSTYNSITINVSATGGDGSIVSYHYSRDDGSNYTESNNANYTFDNLTSSTTFYIKVYVTDSNGRTSSEYSTSVTTESAILADYIVNTVYTGTDGENDLYYHDGNGTYGSQEAGDNSYRYAGENPNNYICFYNSENICSKENLYRIIGVFDRKVKVLYTDSIEKQHWGRYNSSDVWETSMANIFVKEFYDKLDLDITQKIDTSLWQIGGISQENGLNMPKLAYNYEIANNVNSILYQGSIGLIYVSDYGYAASPENWKLKLNNYINNQNWMLDIFKSENSASGLPIYTFWTISKQINSNYVFSIRDSGEVLAVDIDDADNYHSWNGGFVPTFYLKSNVKLISGDGSQADPYIIGM